MLANTAEDGEAALRLLGDALRLDPGYLAAHGYAAWCHEQRYLRGGFDPADRAAALAHADVALGVNADDPQAMSIGAFVRANLTRDYDGAIPVLDRALAINGNSALAFGFSALVSAHSERHERAVAHAGRALRLSPLDDPLNYHPYCALALTNLFAGRFEDAVRYATLTIRANPGFSVAYAYLVAGQVNLGDLVAAQATARRLLEIAPGFSIDGFARMDLFRPPLTAAITAALRQADLPERAPGPDGRGRETISHRPWRYAMVAASRRRIPKDASMAPTRPFHLTRRRFLGTGAAVGGLVMLHPFSARAQAGQAHLRILSTTDLHCHVQPYDYYADKPTDTVGLARTASIIEAIRAEATNTLLVDNGDYLQGNPMGDYIAYERGMQPGDVHPVIAGMNTLGYEAGTLGNHEFNYGVEFLDLVNAGAAFPIVCANFASTLGASPRDDALHLEPYVILSRTVTDGAGEPQAIKVGLIGFVPPQIMLWDRGHLEGRFQTRDIVEAARAWVPQMREAGADIVVALSHSGIDRRRRRPR